MIDPTILRTDPDRIRESQRRRGEDVEIVDRLITADSAQRAAQQRFDDLRNKQKALGKQIGPLQGALKKADEVSALPCRAKSTRSWCRHQPWLTM